LNPVVGSYLFTILEAKKAAQSGGFDFFLVSPCSPLSEQQFKRP